MKVLIADQINEKGIDELKDIADVVVQTDITPRRVSKFNPRLRYHSGEEQDQVTRDGKASKKLKIMARRSECGQRRCGSNTERVSWW